MTIAYLLDDTLDVSDGVQQAMIGIAEAMRSRGHDVHYIVPETKRSDLKNIYSVGHFLSGKFNGNSVRTPLPIKRKTVQKLLEDLDLDILHVQAPYSPFFAGKFIRLSSRTTKVFATFHILPYNRLSVLGTKVLGKLSYRSKRRITTAYAVSEPAAVFMRTTYGIESTVLPNPVDYDFFHHAQAHNKQKQRVVYVGRFEERKGVTQLIQAWGLLPEKLRLSTELVMCGKGPLHDEVRQYAQRAQLAVVLPGYVSEELKAQYLASADIALFPSLSGESFGIVLAEAMAAGAGVTVGGDNPGYHSVLSPWPEALVDSRKPEAIAQTIINFLSNAQLRTRIGSEQHAAVKQYDIKTIAVQLEQDYMSQDL